MIAVKLSVQQLIEALSGLNEKGKIRVREALNKDFEIADTKLEELLNHFPVELAQHSTDNLM